MLIVITGDGKGKTTSAIGQAVRAMGHGRRVFFAQFIKSNAYPSGEDLILRGFGDRLTFFKGGLGFVGIMGDKLPFAAHREAAEATLELAKDAVLLGEYGLVVLDEVNVAMALHLISEGAMLEFLALVPVSCDIILTGRGADTRIIERADLVTECAAIKHPFASKVPAKEGIEF